MGIKGFAILFLIIVAGCCLYGEYQGTPPLPYITQEDVKDHIKLQKILNNMAVKINENDATINNRIKLIEKSLAIYGKITVLDK